MDNAKREGWMGGKGRDSGLGSSAEGAARWKVVDAESGGSDIVVTLSWKLTGALAQFNRAGLVQDIVRRLAATFAANLEATITGSAPPTQTGAALGGFGLVWAVIKSKFARPSKYLKKETVQGEADRPEEKEGTKPEAGAAVNPKTFGPP
jgi:carbon-monoxide dehydrogenase small subunit